LTDGDHLFEPIKAMIMAGIRTSCWWWWWWWQQQLVQAYD